ncbi:c-type cytochrome [Aquabacterium sp. A3]|uniref:c-type cytochrome n=1 Tax=Aquabacterium sp. A3 TaxID=3132829 RepID=UPI003119A513
MPPALYFSLTRLWLCTALVAWAPASTAQTPIILPASTTQAPNIARGQALHKALCLRCHALDQHGIGPAHRGVYNRLAATQAGYEYSTGLKRSRIRWNAQTLDRWLANPDAFVTWQQMDFQVPDAQDRADLIAYLRTLR